MVKRPSAKLLLWRDLVERTLRRIWPVPPGIGSYLYARETEAVLVEMERLRLPFREDVVAAIVSTRQLRDWRES